MKILFFILILSIVMPIIYGVTIFWAMQIMGSLFYTFPRTLVAFLKKELISIKPVFIALSPVFLWGSIVFLFNLLFYIFWFKAFIYVYTNIAVLISVGWALLQCLLQIGNSEMVNYTDRLINSYKK